MLIDLNFSPYEISRMRFNVYFFCSGSAVAQSAQRETPGEEDVGSIYSVAVRSLLFGSVSV